MSETKLISADKWWDSNECQSFVATLFGKTINYSVQFEKFVEAIQANQREVDAGLCEDLALEHGILLNPHTPTRALLEAAEAIRGKEGR